jgi:hypothetical protein
MCSKMCPFGSYPPDLQDLNDLQTCMAPWLVPADTRLLPACRYQRTSAPWQQCIALSTFALQPLQRSLSSVQTLLRDGRQSSYMMSPSTY